MSHLILAGVFNCLIVVLSHILYAVHSVAGLFILSYFHQAFETCSWLRYIFSWCSKCQTDR